ncbi:hypothetical protein HHI36_010868 [Cryptolaemus montrouzieri]|uniref:Ionotropic receptor n=1 Tax=Cryptolaemus montrouzieri TaxID=559131 RepID=A0ABD2MJZ0_9CUCU
MNLAFEVVKLKMLQAPVILSSSSFLQCITNYLLLFANSEKHPILFVHGQYQSMEFNLPTLRIRHLGVYPEISQLNNIPNIFLFDLDKKNLRLLRYFIDLIQTSFHNPRGTIIFAGKNIDSGTVATAERLFMIKTFFVNLSNGSVDTYYPYKSTSFKKNDLSLVNLGTCQNPDVEKKMKTKLSETFSSKDFVGWRFYISNFRCVGGFEHELMEMLFESLKVEALYLCGRQTKIPLAAVSLQRKHELLYASMQMRQAYECDFTYPYIYDTVSFFVARPDPLPLGLYPLKIFNKTTWCFFLSSVMLLSLSYIIIKVVLCNRLRISYFLKTFLNIFFLFVGQGRNFDTNFLSKYILFYTSIYMCFMMNAIYQGKLLYVMLGKQYQNSTVHSYQEIKDKNIKIGFPTDTPLYAQEYLGAKNLLKCGEISECLEKLFKDKYTMVLLLQERTVRRMSRQLINEHGELPIFMIGSPFYSARISAIMPKGSPLLEIVDKQFSYLMMHGYIQHLTLKHDFLMKIEVTFPNVKINMEHVLPLIILWAIGTLISLIMFFGELQRYMHIRL